MNLTLEVNSQFCPGKALRRPGGRSPHPTASYSQTFYPTPSVPQTKIDYPYQVLLIPQTSGLPPPLDNSSMGGGVVFHFDATRH